MLHPIPFISRREWFIAFLIAFGLAGLFLLPYGLGHYLSAPDNVYTGLLINVEDGTYLSAIEQGRQGAWQYQNLFTLEPHEPVALYLFYLFLGHVGRWLGFSTVTIWHLALFVMNLFLFLVAYRFIATFLEKENQRWTAYLLALLGSGWDIFVLPLVWERGGTMETLPLDLKMPEAHLFYSALTYPHFVAGIALILLLFWITIYSWATPSAYRWLLFVAAGAINLLVCTVYPFLFLLVSGVLTSYYLYWAWQERRILWAEGLGLAIVLATPLPLLFYYLYLIQTNEILRQWNEQARTLSPNPIHYLLTYLPFLILAAMGWKQHPKANRGDFLWIWLVVVAVLLYLPLNPQRRFVEGVQIPLAILASFGLWQWVLPRWMAMGLVKRLLKNPRYRAGSLQQLFLWLVLSICSLISLYLYSGVLLTLTVIQPYPLFRPLAEVEAMQWLKSYDPAPNRIFTAYWTGSYLPFVTGDVVFVGQRYETVDFSTKRELSEMFFDAGTTDSWRQQLLRQNQIEFLFWGKAERDLGTYNPDNASFLAPLFQNSQVTIYTLKDD